MTTTASRLTAVFGTAWHVNATAIINQLATEIDGGGDAGWPIAGAAQAAVTDSSGGVASATTGVDANIAKQTIIIPVQLADLAASETYKIAVPFAFTVNSIGFRTGKPASTVSKLATLTAQIAGTAITAGTLALTTANQNATGTLLAATAPSALNVGTAGQTLEVATSSVTAFAEGDGWIEFGVTNNDLANAIATLANLANGLRTGLVTAGVLKGSA